MSLKQKEPDMTDTTVIATSPPRPINNGGANGIRPQVVNNGLKLFGEVLLPGASELLEGRIAKGIAAAGVGLAVPVLSVAVLGPVAALLVGGGTSLAVRILSFSDSLRPEKERDWQFGKSALNILDEKYANGDLTTEQYLERRKILLRS
jgi:uncharacterized membrane protein